MSIAGAKSAKVIEKKSRAKEGPRSHLTAFADRRRDRDGKKEAVLRRQ